MPASFKLEVQGLEAITKDEKEIGETENAVLNR